MTRLSAPIFAFGDAQTLAADDTYTRPSTLEGMLAMTGPSVSADPGCLPVRGDLAHIKLAGHYFVPHYAVPMPHTIKAGAVLRAAALPEGEAIIDLPQGGVFNVLDIAGSWAWGQLGEDGQVGYVLLDQLEAVV
ncbi:SH3 domain-containing protein [Novosphingobium beihaiensis]|uniref:SH3 domain-containing protein n=1 Tax=Novosphingobium beihaiensis TaxID=2930389 RepID=A0ABT0BPG4_9SPHN|nr:SH3 domain-containing protein [Novosphingobium beihaiensis]MCJ2186949.1 SH3 domain-containing protein [Novosphingobium beihaiensis]